MCARRRRRLRTAGRRPSHRTEFVHERSSLEQSLPEASAQPVAQTAGATRRVFPWPLVGILFVVFAVALLWVGHSASTPPRARDAVGALTVTFVSIVLEALPFIMLGSLLGGLIEVYVSRERISSILPRRHSVAILVAACLGLVFPVCECAIVPVTRRLVRKGVPFSVAVAYLLAGPIVNPLVGASTFVAYNADWTVVAIRLLSGFAIAVLVALVMDRIFPGQRALLPDAENRPTTGFAAPKCACAHDHTADNHDNHAAHGDHSVQPTPPVNFAPWFPRRLVHALEHGADEFLYVSQFLIIGAFVAALSQTLVSRQAFLALAGTPAAGILMMMVLAVVLNLCSEADAFVAASFRGALPLSAQLAFMVLGPMLDLKLIAMYLSFVRKRAITMLIVLMSVLVFVAMFGVAYLREGGVS